MTSDFLPLLLLLWTGYFLKNYKTNNFLVIISILSYYAFATNFNDLGFGFDVYRYIHKFIGICIVSHLFYLTYKSRLKNLKNIFSFIFIFYLISILLSLIGNEINLDNFFHYLRNVVFVSLVAIYFINNVDSSEKISDIGFYIFSISLILSIFSIIDFLGHFGYFDYKNYFNDGSSQITRIPIRTQLYFNNPNYLAFAIMIGTPFAIYKLRKFNLLVFGLMAFAVFTTGSKAAEIGVIFIFITYIIFIRKELTLINKLGILFLILSMSLSYKLIISNNNDSIDKSRTRYSIMMIVNEIFNQNPINGIGYAQFRTKYKDFITPEIIDLGNHQIKDAEKNCKQESLERCPDLMTHSDLFSIIAELGIVGGIFIIWVFSNLTKALLSIKKYDRNLLYLNLSITLSVLIFSLFHNNLTNYVFWILTLYPLIYKKLLKI